MQANIWGAALGSKLLKGGSIEDYIEDYYKGFLKGDTRSFDCS